MEKKLSFYEVKAVEDNIFYSKLAEKNKITYI
jgi:hypothetical protein